MRRRARLDSYYRLVPLLVMAKDGEFSISDISHFHIRGTFPGTEFFSESTCDDQEEGEVFGGPFPSTKFCFNHR